MQMCVAQTTAIPDSDFEQRLVDLGFDDVIDGQVLTSNISSVTTLNINNEPIVDLSGIEDFIALENLFASFTSIINLDLSNNVNFEFLNVSNSASLESLNLSNTNLQSIVLSGNNLLNSINIDNTPLTALNINGTQITSLNFNNVQLTSLQVTNTPLNQLNLNNSNISTISLDTPNLNFLDLSNNPNLSTIDLSQLVNLLNLNLSNTNISAIDLSSLSILNTLNVSNTNLDVLDASFSQGLSNLSIDGLNLTELLIDNTNISSLDVSSHSNLTKLQVNSNNNISELNMQNGANGNLGSSDFLSFGTPNLSCIQVDDVTYANATWNNVDSANSFSTDCEFTLALNDNEFNVTFSIYPNPVLDVLNVNTSTPINSLKVYDLKGKFLIASKTTSIDTSLLLSGIYILQIETQKGIENRKIVKK